MLTFKIPNYLLTELTNYLIKIEQLNNFDTNQDIIVYYDNDKNILAFEGIKQRFGWARNTANIDTLHKQHSCIINYELFKWYYNIDTSISNK